MSSLNMNTTEILLKIWDETFEQIATFFDSVWYDKLITLQKKLMADGVIFCGIYNDDPELIEKFNTIVLISTMVVDYESLIADKFNDYFELCNIKLNNVEFNLRYVNKALLSRRLNEKADFKKNCHDLSYWTSTLKTISRGMYDEMYKSQVDCIVTCENYLRMINTLNKTIGKIVNNVKEHNSSIVNYVPNFKI
nr:MAG: P6 protein [Yunnan emara-like virus]